MRHSLSSKLFAKPLLLLGCIGFFLPLSHAATITVDTDQDGIVSDGNCTFREALSAANTDIAIDNCTQGDGDDTIVLPSGNLAFNLGHFTITTDMTITGQGADQTVVDAQSNTRHFIFSGSGTLTLTDVQLTGGRASSGGSIAVSSGGGALIMERVRCTANTASGAAANGGGCISVSHGGSVYVKDSQIDNNVANGDGGVIRCRGNLGAVNITLENSYFHNNSAGRHGGASFLYEECHLKVERSLFESNSATNSGGALNEDTTASTMEVSNSTFVGNMAGGSGGAITHQRLLKLSHSSFYNNTASGAGGAIAEYATASSQLLYAGNIIYGNNAATGPDCSINTVPSVSSGNILGDNTDCMVFSGVNDHVGVDPEILGLSNQGGLWNSLVIAETSIARNNSDCLDVDSNPLSLDQRGWERPASACSSGAYDIDAIEGDASAGPYTRLEVHTFIGQSSLWHFILLTLVLGYRNRSKLFN